MSLAGKLESEVEIKSSAYIFHAVYTGKPQLLKTMIPDTIQSCDLQKGQFGMPGSIIYWNYIDEGEAKVAKEEVEEIDDENFSMKVKVIEGDLLKDYKVFRIMMKATPKGEGSVVHWTLEYERQNPQTPHPQKFLDLITQCTIDSGASFVSCHPTPIQLIDPLLSIYLSLTAQICAFSKKGDFHVPNYMSTKYTCFAHASNK